MNIFHAFLLFSIHVFLVECEQPVEFSEKRTVEARDNCQESIEFKNCKNEHKTIYRNENLKIIAAFKGCKNKKYIYNYNLIEVDTGETIEYPENPSGATLIVNKFSLKNGTYRVVLSINTEKKDVSIFKQNCILQVKVAPPVPLIMGGFQRYISAGMDLIFNASGSIDYNSEYPLSKENFEYSWVYDCDDCNGFQTATEKGEHFVLYGNTHNKEIKYLIKLGIRTKWWNETVFAQQLVYLRKSTPGLEIVCVQNCYPPFGHGDMKLVAYCTSDCPQNTTWSWNVYKVPKNDDDVISGTVDWEQQLSRTGLTDNFTVLKEDELPHNAGILVTLSLNGFSESVASYKFISLPKNDWTCSIHPKHGFVLETKFKFECTGTFGSYYWAAIGLDQGHEQVLDYDSSWEYLSFIVPRKGMVSFHSSDYTGIENFLEWHPGTDDFKLYEIEKTPDAIAKLYNKGNESVKALLQSGDFGGAMDKMTIIAKSISKINASEYHKVEKTAKKLIYDLKKLPLKDTVRLEQAAAIMAALTTVDKAFDPHFAEVVTTFCRNLAGEYRKMVKHEYLGGKTSDMPVHVTVGELMQCTSAGNRPNLTAIEQKVIDIKVTTVDYISEDGNINTETYDEYKDESGAFKSIATYKHNIGAFVDVCNLNGRALIRRMMSMHLKKTDEVKSEMFSVVVAKMPGYEIVQAPLKALGVKVVFSKDLVDSELLHALIMCATRQNLFWWQSEVDIISDILIITMKINDTFLTKYEKPFELIFKLSGRPRMKFPSLQSSVRMRRLLRDPEDPEEEQLSVYVIFLEAGYSFVVHFRDLDRGLNLNMPILTDFKENMQILSRQDYYYANEEVYNYDTIRLLAVIPSPPNEAGFRKTNEITCYCTSLSTITTTVKNIPIKAWADYIPLPVELEENHFYGVYIVVIVIFLLYCVAICFTVCEEDYTLKAIYFLSDVVRDDRYGYLIVVQTSFRFGSGTTSNVMINLKGTKGESEPHVLNYPDPLMVLLQRHNEDWFLLATNKNIGRITEIELWIDGVGFSPTWQCSTLVIFDLQHRRWYNFRISQTFNIYPKPQIYCKSYPIDEMKDRTSMRVVIGIFQKCLPTFKLFNLSLRRTDEAMSYIKRLTMILSILSSIAVWCIIINGVPHMSPTDNIMKTCTFTINPSLLSHGIGGSITTAVYHIPIKYFFLTSKVQLPYHPVSQKSKKPMIFTVLCWCAIAALISFNLTFITIYGVWIPDVTTIGLATEIIIGMIFYIFIVDVIYSSINKMINGGKELENYIRRLYYVIFDDIEKQRLILYRVFGKFLLRPFLKHLYSPLHGVALRVLWHTEKTKYEVKELLENLLMFFIYMGLMYMVILANKDYRSVYSNQQVKNIIAGHATRTFPFAKVISVKTLDKYLEKTMIPATQSHVWYGKYAVKDPGMTVDYNNKLLGVVRLRQHRAERKSCQIPEMIAFINCTCVADYFHSHTKKSYGEKWKAKNHPPLEGRMKDVWRFTPKNETGSPTYIGKLGVYSGGGYVAFLGRGMKNSLVNLEYLRSKNWLDRQTRSLFIEFLLYNANFNIFNAVQYNIEKSGLGYLKKDIEVETSKMLLKESENIVAIPILLGLFLFLVVVFSIRALIRIKKTRVWYFRDLWHLVDIVLIILSMACVYMFYRRSKEVGVLLKSLEGKDHKEFVNYFPLLGINTTFTVVCAILITVASLKLWGLFRFIIIFRVVEKTFRTSFQPLCALFIYNGIVILAFAGFGFPMFVDHSYRFEGYFNTLEFLILLNLRPFEGEEINMLVEPKMGLGYVFYVSYAITVTLFSCLYTALIIIYYAKAQDYYSNYSDIYSVWDYLRDQFQFYFNVWRIRFKSFRLGGGHDKKESIPVSPKSDETRFTGSYTLSVDKIRAMSLITLCVIRNSDPDRKPLTQRDIRIMTYALYYLNKLKHKSENGEDVERFYKGKMGLNSVKLIHETVLKKVEAATSILLGRTLQETLKEMNVNRDAILMEENTRQLTRTRENLSIMLETIKRINIRIFPQQ